MDGFICNLVSSFRWFGFISFLHSNSVSPSQKEFPPSAWREAEQFPSQHYAVIATLCQDQEKSLPELAEQLLTRILQVWTSHEEVDIGSEGQEVSEEQRSALEQLLQKTIPVVAKRKSYGLLKVSDLEANENTDPECRWVWEAEVMDHIPRALRAEVRSSRRHRMADAAHLRAVAKLVSMYSSKVFSSSPELSWMSFRLFRGG